MGTHALPFAFIAGSTVDGLASSLLPFYDPRRIIQNNISTRECYQLQKVSMSKHAEQIENFKGFKFK